MEQDSPVNYFKDNPISLGVLWKNNLDNLWYMSVRVEHAERIVCTFNFHFITTTTNTIQPLRASVWSVRGHHTAIQILKKKILLITIISVCVIAAALNEH